MTLEFRDLSSSTDKIIPISIIYYKFVIIERLPREDLQLILNGKHKLFSYKVNHKSNVVELEPNIEFNKIMCSILPKEQIILPALIYGNIQLKTIKIYAGYWSNDGTHYIVYQFPTKEHAMTFMLKYRGQHS